MKLKDQHFKALSAALGVRLGGIMSSGYAMLECPLAPWRHASGKDKSPSFSVKRSGRCHCFACGFIGDLGDLSYLLKYNGSTSADFGKVLKIAEAAEAEGAFDLSDVGEYDDPKQGEKIVFPDWWLESFPGVDKFDEARIYLGGRKGGSIPSLVYRARLDMRFDPIRRRVCFPIRDDLQQVIGFHGRAIDEKNEPPYMRYKVNGQATSDLLLGENWVDFDEPLLVTEGPFDLARCLQVYQNACCTLSAGFTGKVLDKIGRAHQIWTLFDEDDSGRAARAKVERLAGKKRQVRHLSPGEFHDAGAMPAEVARDLIWKFLPEGEFIS